MTTDHELQAILEARLREVPPLRPTSLADVFAKTRTIPQRRHRWPLHVFGSGNTRIADTLVGDPVHTRMAAANGPTLATGFTMLSALRFIAASVIVALFGGLLLAGILAMPRGDQVSPAAPTTSPSPTVYRFTDPRGDGTDGDPDFLAVSATKKGDDLALDVELTDSWDLASPTVVGWLFSDPTSMTISGQEQSLPRPDFCNPWFMESYQLAVGGSWPSGQHGVALTSPDGSEVHEVPYELDGSHLHIEMPLAWLGDPTTVSFYLQTDSMDRDSHPADIIPDTIGGFADGCLYVILEGEPPSPVEYDFEGFFSPVDDPDINVARAGSAIPVRFSLGGDEGFGILKREFPKVTPISCDTREPLNPEAPASSAERLDWTYSEWAGRYTWVWPTSEDWAGSCYHFELGLQGDSEHGFDVRFEPPATDATVSRFLDPSGDAAEGTADIVALTTTATSEELLLEVEFADDWDPTESRLVVWLYPDPEPPSDYRPIHPVWTDPRTSMPDGSPGLAEQPNYCNPYSMDMVWIEVSERPDLAAMFGAGASMVSAPETLLAAWSDDPLSYEIDGERLGLTLPLATLGDPDTLSLHLMDPDDEGIEPNEQFPDQVDICVLVPLAEG